MTKNNQDRNGTRTVTTDPNRANDLKFAARHLFRLPDTHNKLAVQYVIAAIRSLAALYSNAAEMLDSRLERTSLAGRRQEPGSMPEVVASLDPSDFVDDDDQPIARPRMPNRS